MVSERTQQQEFALFSVGLCRVDSATFEIGREETLTMRGAFLRERVVIVRFVRVRDVGR
jgi:hypothetical protein